ncbi:MAG: LytTR family DNA-binding domain-containing protein [Prevotellaceae bacterium]|jgi:DNA-binding LytR/AlgR family response regulator|nr:LytTR family DNA-binding domain-containing protein [Prevotellaceae bacterium]
MKVLIVEDEMAAYSNLSKIFDEIEADVEITGNTESVRQTVKLLRNAENLPDLIFMDIHLSDGSAFNIFSMTDVNIPVVFTTAYDEYAIEAFKVNSIDYLLKPIEAEEVKRALDKYNRLNDNSLKQYLQSMSQMKPNPQPDGDLDKFPDKIIITQKDKLIPVSLNSISYFYTTEEKTTAILNDGKSYIYKRTLDSIIQSLNPKKFFRVNKQFIISRKSVENITVCIDNRLLISLYIETPERIFVSKNKAAEFKQWLTC